LVLLVLLVLVLLVLVLLLVLLLVLGLLVLLVLLVLVRMILVPALKSTNFKHFFLLWVAFHCCDSLGEVDPRNIWCFNKMSPRQV
jgi:hypothetical protein